MVQFGKQLLESRHEPWADYYLNYRGLKQCLVTEKKKLKQLEDLPPPPPGLPHQIEFGSPVARGSPAYSASSPPMSHDESERTLEQPHHDTRDFETFLEDEVEKIGLFFLQIQGEIASELNQVRSRQSQFLQDFETNPQAAHKMLRNSTDLYDEEQSGSPGLLQQFLNDFHSMAVTLLRLIHFVEANVTGIRKILKKHDKVTKKHLTYQYISFPLGGGKNQQLKHLWTRLLLHQYEGITALTVTLKVAITELKNIQFRMEHRQERVSMTPDGKPPLPYYQQRPPLPFKAAKAQHQSANSMPNIVLSPEDVASAAILSKAIVASGGTAVPNSSLTPQSLSFKRVYGSTRGQLDTDPSAVTTIELDAVMLKVEAARRRLNVSSNTFQDMLAAQMLELEMDGSDRIPDEQDDEEDAQKDAKDDKWLSHLLNLSSTFLYMTNYYVVAPTSGHYAQLLGGDEAMSGIIIGMTPIAALVSTILYSWWTSHSYKAALVFASTCSILGNIFYALGLPCNSMTFVLIGRLLNGFGSARSINRRYIADTFPPRQRTAQSANFVSAGALGMAAGPAIASLLHIGSSSARSGHIGSFHEHEHTEETFVDKNGVSTTIVSDDDSIVKMSANLWWTPENAPGWVMFAGWSIFLGLLLFHFEDPPKPLTSKVLANEAGEGNGETETLIPVKTQESSSDYDLLDDDDKVPKEVPIWRNVPAMITFLVYFVLKLVLECLLSSTATLTTYYFSWDSSIGGIYLAILGMLMLPANLGISILARNHDDRELILGCEVSMLLGCCGIIQYSSKEGYTAIQYIFFSVVIFLSTNALEGPNMSLLSKTIPKSWSRGIFNVGLLATEAGTLGRAVGDVLLSAWGFEGLGTLLNDTFRAMSILCTISLALTLVFFEQLEPHEKDD